MGRFNWGREVPPEEAYSRVTVDPEGGRVVNAAAPGAGVQSRPVPGDGKAGTPGELPSLTERVPWSTIIVDLNGRELSKRLPARR